MKPSEPSFVTAPRKLVTSPPTVRQLLHRATATPPKKDPLPLRARLTPRQSRRVLALAAQYKEKPSITVRALVDLGLATMEALRSEE